MTAIHLGDARSAAAATQEPATSGQRAAGSAQATVSSVRRWRLRYAVVCLVFVTVCLNTDSGRIAPDTKLDLTAAPGKFLARALTLWDPQGFAGQLQNQAYGYLFPMGPFFWLGHSLGIPAWAIQRLWWSALLCAAFLGIVVLAGRMRIGTPLTRLIGGVAYATTPHVVMLLGSNSIEALPTCVAPWVLIPLVGPAALRAPRLAAALSGVAVLVLGGVNAAAASAALVPAAVWLAYLRPVRTAVRLAAWWVVSVVLATFWWVVPLLLLGRFSPPFLDYIESATTTTRVNSLLESLRGTSDWVPYLPGSGWHAGWLLLTQPTLVILSVVVAAIGIVGVMISPRAHRGYLVTLLLIGLVLLTFGHLGTMHSDYVGWARGLLDGALAPLRNLHKFDLVIRLPLALGLVHAVASIRWGALRVERRLSAATVSAVAAVAVIGTAAPLIALKADSSGSYAQLPAYWKQAAVWLGAQHATGRSLVVPSSRFATYGWGIPPDEPLQPLATTPWEVRNAIPLVPPGHIRVLDAIQAQLDSGTGSPGLAPYLSRAGIRYLVVRNDLDYGTGDATRPVLTHAVLAASRGLREVAHFGPNVGVDNAFGFTVDQHLQVPYPAVEVWQVAGSSEQRVSLAPASSVVDVAGGPESLLPLETDGVLGASPAVLGDEGLPGLTVLTDGMRRREVNFGGLPSDKSATLPSGDNGVLGAAGRDYLPAGPSRMQSTAALIGATAITASSSAAAADSFPRIVPIDMPYSAFDGNPATGWLTNPGVPAAGQWLQIDFDAARGVNGLSIDLADTTARANTITVTTSHGSVSTPTTGTGRVALTTPPGPTPFLRITFTYVQPDTPLVQVGIGEVNLDRLHVERTIDVRADLPRDRPVSAIDFSAAPGARSGCVRVDRRSACAVGLAQRGEDDAAVDRTFTLPVGATYAGTVTASPRPGKTLDSLIDAWVGSGVRAAASSQAVADPLAGASAAMDHDLGTGWVAAAHDHSPTLTVTLARPTRLRALTISEGRYLAGTRPDTVVIRAGSRAQVAHIDANGRATFRPIVARSVRLSFSSAALSTSVNPVTKTFTAMGIGISELKLDGVSTPSRARTDATPVQVPCGGGPSLVVDGKQLLTSATMTVQALRDMSPVTFHLCGGRTSVPLGAGTHRVVVTGTSEWRAGGILLRDPAAAAPDAAGAAPIEVRHWDRTSRSVQLGARSAESLLVVHENVNAGWRAKLNGITLRKVTVDGWQQGYVVPAGAPGVLTLDFVPDHAYRAALLVGLAAVLVLALLAAVPAGRRRRSPPGAGSIARGTVVIPVLGLGFAIALAGLVAGSLAVAGTYLLAAGLTGSLGASAWNQRARAIIAAGLVLAAGINLAVHPWPQSDYAGDARVAQVLCLCAILLMTVPRRLPLVRRSGAEPSPEPGAAAASPAAPPNGRPVPTRESSGPSWP